MRPLSTLLALTCLAALALTGQAVGGEPPLRQRIRDLLGGIEFDGCEQLIDIGEKAFPAYEAILSDPKADPNEVIRVLFVLCNVNADRQRFVKHALSRLTDAKSGVRLNAVSLLGQIGTAADSSPVVALLSDDYGQVARAAARTLVAIGGRQEVLAMDVWLRGASHHADDPLMEYVKGRRRELKERLDKAAKKAK